MSESVESRLGKLASRRDATRPQAPDRWDVTNMAIALRWGALCIALLGLFGPIGSVTSKNLRQDVLGALLLVVYCVARTLRPIRSGDSQGVLVAETCAEAAFLTAIALVTGGWSSPLLLMVGCSLMTTGLLGGLPVLGASVVTVLVVVFAAEVAGSALWLRGVHSAVAAQRIPELIVMGIVGAYVHGVFFSQGSRYNQLRWMNEVSALLLELYTVAAEHPGVFTVEGAVNATVTRLREAFSPDVVAVLLRHPTAEGTEEPWEVVHREGTHLPLVLGTFELPTAMFDCASTLRPIVCEELLAEDRLDASALSGLYAPIVARGAVIGLIALERRGAPKFVPQDAEAVQELMRNAGLAIDNARSYLRLRSLGADEERERIARELHDRVGQTLAAIAFNIDRVITLLPPEAEEKIRPDLEFVASEVRGVNAQIRGKLSELRGGPTESIDLARLLQEYLTRVEMRSTLQVSFEHALHARLSDVAEREIWRIASEAIRNAELHSGAQHLAVSLLADSFETVLEVTDDGAGIDSSQLLRPDAFGLVGMRERADLIEGSLVVDSSPGAGTTVRLRVPRR